ncbi:hypothetical protein KKF84_13330 [Myxococcota bacterium]|nr:hypothetical protein [Myxococcota bacterium]MBU1536301.1 hypothetical protein [Myxococcota bacterium]
MSDEKRFQCVKEACEVEYACSEGEHIPSWMRRAFVGAGLVLSMGAVGCCMKSESSTTADNPPPREAAPPSEKPREPAVPPVTDPKPPPREVRPQPPMDTVRPLYAVR